MKEILDTTQLEFEKSIFLIGLVEHSKGKLYIEITQRIKSENLDNRAIKINPSILSDLIDVLQNYQTEIRANRKLDGKHLSESDKQKIQDRYLKGVPIEDLAIQFDQSAELIEMILRNKGIELVSKKPPKPRRQRRRRKWS